MTEYSQLFEEVMQNSTSKKWEIAVGEWGVLDCVVDPYCTSQCICGKENIKYLYTISNSTNGNKLFPIGSSCIKKFGEARLISDADVLKAEFELVNAVKQNMYISLKDGLFSRKLLEKLHTEGAFNTAYNNFKGDDDYEFMVKMFNKRGKGSILQSKKVDAIILNSIIPHLKSKLQHKVIQTKNDDYVSQSSPATPDKDKEQE